MNLIDEISEEVRKRCENFENKFGYGIWTHHVKAVVENAIFLAENYDADVEVITLAALLHDIASITKDEYKDEHHIYGAKMAEEMLNAYSYPKDKIELIKNCILHHRGSRPAEKSTIEEICVADADAMAHFDNIPSLFSLVYKERELNIDEGAKFVKDKLYRSYDKLSDRTKELYKDKFEGAMSIF
ncbi:MAG: HD domain-containing protein [Clostridioides sp.]|jgi:uncharacterized protein|nr:HD domain-containing protein [Clostridioides sp.]